MRLQRVSMGSNEHRGTAFMIVTCSCEAELDSMVAILNVNWKREWGTIYEDGERVDSMATQYLIDIDWLDDFKVDYKAAKKGLK